MVKVSVIIPFYKNILWLEEAVESVLKQTFHDLEIIVVNDGSPECDKDFLYKYGNSIQYYKTVNMGAAHARNIGIDCANGKYLAFLDSDDLWDVDKLKHQISVMEFEDAVWSHTNYRYFSDTTGDIIEEFDLNDFNGNIFPKSLVRCHIATPSVVIRKDFLDGLSLKFEETMRTSQDYFLWLNVSSYAPIRLIPETLVSVRYRGKNTATLARAHIRMRAQVWRFIKNTSILSGVPYIGIVKNLYRLCSVQNDILVRLDKKFNSGTLEYISKFFYVLPYLGFKFLYMLMNKR